MLAERGVDVKGILRDTGSTNQYRNRAAPQVKPAPQELTRMRSPFRIRPLRTASSKATGMEAAEVLPYLWTVMITFSVGIPNRPATTSIIRILAWWGMNQSIS